jgi:menaquinone-dependent protoporphyrinogen oxidase
MRVLVAAASKHGSTSEIAQAIATELTVHGLQAEARDVAAVRTLDGYDAVVLGSAVYVGKWMSEAKAFVEANAERLRTLPVWLFSSGPLGETPMPNEDPADVPELMTATGAREHRLLVGALDKDKLGLGERLVVRMVKAPYGDFRDPATIRQWADHIAGELTEGLEAQSPSDLQADPLSPGGR